LAALVVFFSSFNVMEALLPSLITKVAPAHVKGTAMGVYSSLQFLGIFVGGIIGGFAHQHGGSGAVFAASLVLALIWLSVAARMAQPSHLMTRLLPLAEGKAADGEKLAARLRQVPGVVEAMIVVEENVAYLKVDPKSFDATLAESLASQS
jgi:MFS family permease